MPPSPRDECVTNPLALRALMDELVRAGRFALDTEFVSEDTYRPALGLIQVATSDRAAAIDPLAIGPGPLRAFWKLVCDPNIAVVMHAPSEDLRIIGFEAGRLPDRVIDMQIAAALLGHAYPISHSNLVERELGIRVSSSETRTDWRRRPLSDAQLRYALDDVRYLLPLADRILTALHDLGRMSWAEQEWSTLLASVRARDDSERWRRLPGLQNLNRRGLETARRLALWRQEEAQRTNRPLRQILRDDVLIAIAQRMPTNRREFEALRDAQRPHLLARADELIDCVLEARQVPEHELPHPIRRAEELPGQALVINLLSAGLGDAAARHRLAAPLVGTNADLRELLHWFVNGSNPQYIPAILQGWRGSIVADALIPLLEGRVSLRITNPQSETPVTFESDSPSPAPDPPRA